MTYPVFVAIRELVHRHIDCPGGDHSPQCNGLADAILQLMQQYGLPSGPPIRRQPDPMND